MNLAEDLTDLLQGSELDANAVFAEAQMWALDAGAAVDSFCRGFALAAFLYGTDPGDDPDPDNSYEPAPELTGAI